MSKEDMGSSSLNYYSERHQQLLLRHLESDLRELTRQAVTVSVEQPFCFLARTPTEVLARIWYQVDSCEIIERVTVRSDLLAKHRKLFYDALPKVEIVFERLRPYLGRP